MKKRRPPADEPLPDGTGRLGNNPFGALKGRFPGGDGTAAPPEPRPTEAQPPAPEPARNKSAKPKRPAPSGPKPSAQRRAPEPAPTAGRVIVRREKKGRGGKTMTRVSGLGLDAKELEEFARTMKRALGCGAVVEDDDVLVQGAQTERAAAWLRTHGHADVRIGN